MNVTQDWTRFSKRISVNASVKQIYDAWAIPDNLHKWFLRKAELKNAGTPRKSSEPVQVGDNYEWRWFGHPDVVMEIGEFKVANGMNRLQFTFAQSIVTVNITTEAGETVVEVMQEEIPINFFIDCMTGWTFYLSNLKSVLEGGRDLRNRNEKLKNVINS
jgi:uncharacterized protein YndB with AHSA1/START domain